MYPCLDYLFTKDKHRTVPKIERSVKRALVDQTALLEGY